MDHKQNGAIARSAKMNPALVAVLLNVDKMSRDHKV